MPGAENSGDGHGRVLAALWTRAREAGIHVTYHAHLSASDARLGGYFYVHEGRVLTSMKIALFHPERAPIPQTEPCVEGDRVLADICTLAHEFGHYLSWAEKRADWPEYHAATLLRDQTSDAGGDPAAALTLPQKELILEEEARAWRLGRTVLVELGFDDFGDYDGRPTGAPRSGSAAGRSTRRAPSRGTAERRSRSPSSPSATGPRSTSRSPSWPPLQPHRRLGKRLQRRGDQGGGSERILNDSAWGDRRGSNPRQPEPQS